MAEKDLSQKALQAYPGIRKYIRNWQDPEQQLRILHKSTEAMNHVTETLLALRALSKDGRYLQLAKAGEQKEKQKESFPFVVSWDSPRRK